MNKILTSLLFVTLNCSPLQATAAQSFPAANVNVVKAKMASLSPVAWASGTVVSQNDANLAVEVSGRLISVASIGTQVIKGQVIARLDDQQLAIQLHEEQADLLNNQAQLRFLEAEVVRKKQLVNKKLAADTELDKTISERDIAQADVMAAQARVANAKQRLSYTKLKAPFAGLVVERIAKVGEYVNSGTAIIRLVQTANSEAAIFAPIVAYQFLKNAKQLTVESPLGTGMVNIKTIVPVAHARSHLMEVRVDMAQLDWPIGLNVKAKVVNGPSEVVLAVPRDALVLRRDGASVFRINKKGQAFSAQQIPVEIGSAMDNLVAITSILATAEISEGDAIVIRGAERLQDGQAVKIKSNNAQLLSGDKPSSLGNR